ncbi:MAG TPA: NAD(P)-dependent oxidoreductase, partial [Candidatus Brocadiia bacterium]|nr:NAD(P)-dependent oxidoreductase [Candidatus Brocadiia bacterium]
EGKWTTSPDFCYWDYPLVELAGLTMGVVGYGRIGQKVARLAQAFGMKVVAHTRTPPHPAPEGVRFVGLDALFRESDVVSLNCPLTPETEGLVNAHRLGMMKASAFLINTSRGPLVDEGALAQALNAGRLAGAGLDVLCKEPPLPDNPLLKARNCFITPHLAWGTQAARARLMDVAVGNVKAFIEGRPRNVVS